MRAASEASCSGHRRRAARQLNPVLSLFQRLVSSIAPPMAPR